MTLKWQKLWKIKSWKNVSENYESSRENFSLEAGAYRGKMPKNLFLEIKCKNKWPRGIFLPELLIIVHLWQQTMGDVDNEKKWLNNEQEIFEQRNVS